MTFLKQARQDFKETFEENSLVAYAYDVENPKGPCVLVFPHPRYLRRQGIHPKTMKTIWSIGLNLIVIGNKGTKPDNSDYIDDLIEQVIDILSPKKFVAVVGVEAPGVVTLYNGDYYGAVIEVEYNPVQT